MAELGVRPLRQRKQPKCSEGAAPRRSIGHCLLPGSPPFFSRSRTLMASPCRDTSSVAMAPPDPEKHAAVAAADGSVSERVSGRLPLLRRRILPCLAACAALLFVVEIATSSSGACSASSVGVDRTTPELASPRIRGRSPPPAPREEAATTASAAAPTGTVLKTFEVAQPVLMPDGPAESDGSARHAEDYSPELCTVLLMRHDFAWSYGAPFVGELPPEFGASDVSLCHVAPNVAGFCVQGTILRPVASLTVWSSTSAP